jgi:hypothetical protein
MRARLLLVLTGAIVNPNAIREQVKLDLSGAVFKDSVTQWVIANPNPESYNTPGEAPEITIQQRIMTVRKSSVVVPPYSVRLYRLGIH